MNKVRLYLETSIWNYHLGQGSPTEKEATHRLLAAARDGRYEIFVSDLVVQELVRTPDEARRKELLQAVAEYRPAELEVDVEVRRLADEYMACGIVSEKMRNDVVHAAIATLAQVDVVVSWNLKHLVNPRTRRMVNGINNMLGYGRIDFGTPEEVIAYEP